MAVVARRFVITGRVQGVGYRYYTLRAACQYQIRGWVRNLPDGSVEAWVEGTPESIEKLKHDLAFGPMYAEVRKISETAVEPTGHFDTFRING